MNRIITVSVNLEAVGENLAADCQKNWELHIMITKS